MGTVRTGYGVLEMGAGVGTPTSLERMRSSRDPDRGLYAQEVATRESNKQKHESLAGVSEALADEEAQRTGVSRDEALKQMRTGVADDEGPLHQLARGLLGWTGIKALQAPEGEPIGERIAALKGRAEARDRRFTAEDHGLNRVRTVRELLDDVEQPEAMTSTLRATLRDAGLPNTDGVTLRKRQPKNPFEMMRDDPEGYRRLRELDPPSNDTELYQRDPEAWNRKLLAEERAKWRYGRRLGPNGDRPPKEPKPTNVYGQEFVKWYTANAEELADAKRVPAAQRDPRQQMLIETEQMLRGLAQSENRPGGAFGPNAGDAAGGTGDAAGGDEVGSFLNGAPLNAAPSGTRRGDAPAAFEDDVPPPHPPVSLSSMRRLAALEPIIQEAADAYGVPPEIVRGVIHTESRGNPKAISPAGAQGLMQLMPGTAADLRVRDPFDSYQNIMGGTRYLAQLYKQTGSWPLALWSYNAGLRNMQRGVLPAETALYVPKVMKFVGVQQRQEAP